jgi:hypothetical protein
LYGEISGRSRALAHRRALLLDNPLPWPYNVGLIEEIVRARI